MIRVLQVVNAADRGGAETMIMNLYRNINRDEIQFDFTNHNGRRAAYDDEIESLGGQIHHLPKFKGYNYSQYVAAWRDLFRKHPEYKIVHIHNYNIAGIVSKIAHKMGVPTIITHSHSTRLNMPWVKKKVFYLFYQSLLKYSTHRFSCGENAGKFLFKDKDFTIVPNAIDVNRFKYNPHKRAELRAKLGIPDTATVYGNVGTFRTPKNHSFLIDIFAEIHKVRPESKLLLIGSGELLENIKKKVTDLNLQDSVFFLGQRSNVNEWLSAFDVFLMPSLWEGFPVSVVEAQCAGLPCAVSDVIDSSVNITGEVSFISLKMDATKWRDVIQSISPTDRDRMGEIISASNFDIEKASRWLNEFYKSSITGN